MLLRISGLAALLLLACGGKVYESTGSDPGSSGSNTSGGISSGGASSGSASGGVSSGGTSSGSTSGGTSSGGTSSGGTSSGGTSSGGPVMDPPNCVDWTPVPGIRVSGTRAVRDVPYVFGQDEYVLRATKPHATGRYFFEVDVLSQAANQGVSFSLGIHNGAGLATNDYCLFDAAGQWIDYRFDNNGFGTSSGFSSQGTFKFVQNNTIGVGVDLDAKEISLYINGALREVKQVQYCLRPGPMFPSAVLQLNDEVMGRFQNFRYPIAGYAPWGECN